MFIQEFQLTGLTCGACVKLVERRLQSLPDLTMTEIGADGRVKVTAKREIRAEEIRESLSDTPYNVV